EGFRSARAHSYTGTRAETRDFAAGAYVIDLNQPMKRLAKAQLEPNAEVDADFAKNEYERAARNERRGKNVEKEEAEFYDITSWSLPLASGVEAYWTEDTPSVRSARVEVSNPSGDAGRNRPQLTPLTASDSQPLPGLGGVVEGGRANSAYIIPYGTDAGSRLAIALLSEGYRVAVATRQLNAGGRNWPAGTLIARVHRNPETLHARVAALAAESGARVWAVNSAYSDEGDTGIGSETVASLRKPVVAVIWDEATSPTSYGAVWYAFEREYGLKFTPVSINAIKSADLSKFTCIILPDGSAGGYATALGKAGVDKLKEWAQRGGVLVGVGGGAAMFTRKDVDMSSSRLVGATDDAQPPADAQPAPQKQPAETKPSEARKQAESAIKPEARPEERAAPKKRPTEPIAVPGASFRARLNREHYLSYGYDADTLAVLVDGTTFFRPSKDGANVVTFEGSGPLVIAGFTWPDNTEELLRGTAYVIDEPTGSGHVILFAEDPNFRFLWRTTAQMFINSILLAPSLR
ncbi:MAG TPA: hypothetical protein VJQ56_13760, partial [Blastocatellia bacterium]|nr:hypothetical protein [Blastocatellia bacterium]